MQQADISPALSDAKILKGAITTGAANAVINGAIQLYLLRGSAPIPLSVDGITNDDHTVFGAAVPLAVSLAMILTLVAHLTLKAPKRPSCPTCSGSRSNTPCSRSACVSRARSRGRG